MEETIFEKLRNIEAEKKEKAKSLVRDLAYQIADGNVPPAAIVVKDLAAAGVSSNELEAAVTQININRNLQLKADKAEIEANELATQFDASKEELGKLMVVDAAIGLESAGLREAEYAGDREASTKIHSLTEERVALKTKIENAHENLKVVLDRILRLQSKADDCRRSILPIFGVRPNVSTYERVTVTLPSRYNPDPIINSPPNLPRLEQAGDLVQQGTSRAQICKMLGLSAEWMVDAEVDSPGYIIAQNTWEDPRWAAIREKEQQAAAKERAVKQQAEQQKARAAAAAAIETTPCIETPYELWRERVPVEQSAKMLRKSYSDVCQLFSQFDANEEKQAQERKIEKANDVETRLAERLAAAGK